MPKFIEMDRTVTLADQLKDEGGPVVLVNTFVVPPEDADQLLAVWTADAGIMKVSIRRASPGGFDPAS